MKIVYLNGEFLPPESAKVSVLDRGFLFGDGVYEVIPVYDKHLFCIKEHLERLQKSLDAIRLKIDFQIDEWKSILNELVEKNLAANGVNQSIYLQVTRGYAAERNHQFPQASTPTIFAQSMPFNIMSMEELSKGMTAITLLDTRWQLCFIKAIALLPNVLLYQQAKEAGAHEAILIRDREVIEASTSNVFIVKNGVLKTPVLSSYLLNGITRNLILELAKSHQLPNEETKITEEELRTAEEIWITSSTREIYPIVKLDNHPVGDGKPGSVWHKMIGIYRDYTQQFAKGQSNE